MANGAGPEACEACGRQLPPQKSNGRPRHYCDATCRSAARRERELAGGHSPGFAEAPLTADQRHENLDNVAAAADPVAVKVRRTARRLVGELARPGTGSPLAA